MIKRIFKEGILTGNQLKIIAMLAMTSDHAGKMLFPDVLLLQIIGRLAFPVFAYMIAEGCTYTSSRSKYLSAMAAMALGMQIVYFFAMKSLYMSIFVTFAMSIILIYIADYAKKKQSISGMISLVTAVIVIYYIAEVLPHRLPDSADFCIDYGFCGVMLPAVVYLANKKHQKLILTALILVVYAFIIGSIQWCALLALIPLALYNGKRGKLKIKWFFYIYYPMHMVIIYLISLYI